MKHTAILSLTALSLLSAISTTVIAEPEIEVLTEMQQRPGNPAVGPDGTVYLTAHPFDNPEYKILRISDGKAIPYPNPEVSRRFASVIGIQATQDGTVWWLDMGNENISPKLVGWDTGNDQLKAVHVIPREASVANSFHQDFAIDEKRNKAFIADMSRGGMIDDSNPAIVVIDLETGSTRRVLSGNRFFQPNEKPIIADGKVMQVMDDKGKAHDLKLGLNPLSIDPENTWVYFSTMTPGHLYRVPAHVLGDFSMSEAEIEKTMEIYAEKPSSDGIAVGKGGRVYITTVAENAISVADADGTSIWIKDSRLVWPDAAYVAPDDSLVVTVNQLNRAAAFNDGKPGAEKPYLVVRITDR